METDCPACDGTGLDRWTDNIMECTHCMGTGVVYRDDDEDEEDEY